MVNWLQLSIPVAYLTVLIGSLAVFSSLYRQRKAAKAASLAPWFPPHLQRNIYLSLLHSEPEPGQPKAPDSLLKAALLRRAMEDFRRAMQLRSGKQPLQSLLQRGSVGDELWQRFQRAEAEIEEELKDVMNEANGFQQGWGTYIFQTANEMVNNELLRSRYADIQAETDADKARWEKRRAEIQASFMKELDEEGKADDGGAKQGAKAGSDDDAVLVEAVGPASVPGKNKKKKGKH